MEPLKPIGSDIAPMESPLTGVLRAPTANGDIWHTLPLRQSTLKRYRGEWHAFEMWCNDAGFSSLPSSSETIVRYLQAAYERGRKQTGLALARATISVVHEWYRLQHEEVENPARSRRVSLVLAQIRVNGDKDTRPRKRKALRYEDLERVVAALPDDLAGARLRALVVVGWWGLLRASELLGLRVEDVEFERDGADLRLRDTKTGGVGEQSAALPLRDDVALCPVRELRRWLSRSGIVAGPLFPRLRRRAGELCVTDRALSYPAYHRFLRDAFARAGIPMASLYSTHSLRRGAATELAKSGGSITDLQEAGRWRSVAIAAGYVESAGVSHKAGVAGLHLTQYLRASLSRLSGARCEKHGHLFQAFFLLLRRRFHDGLLTVASAFGSTG